MVGRPPWSTAGTNGGGQTVAVNNRPEREGIDASSTTNVADGSSESIEIYAPTGAIYDVRAMRLRALAASNDGSTGGEIDFRVFQSPYIDVTDAEASYNTPLHYQSSHWVSANNVQNPSNQAAQALAPEKLLATENEPITVRFSNRSGVTYTQKRDILFTVEEVSY